MADNKFKYTLDKMEQGYKDAKSGKGKSFANMSIGEGLGAGARHTATGAKFVGENAMDLLNPDLDAWKSFIPSNDDKATMGDLGNVLLDASTFIPGVGLLGKAAVRGGLKAGARGAKSTPSMLRKAMVGDEYSAARAGLKKSTAAKNTGPVAKVASNAAEAGHNLVANGGRFAKGKNFGVDLVTGRVGGLLGMPLSNSKKAMTTKVGAVTGRNIYDMTNGFDFGGGSDKDKKKDNKEGAAKPGEFTVDAATGQIKIPVASGGVFLMPEDEALYYIQQGGPEGLQAMAEKQAKQKGK